MCGVWSGSDKWAGPWEKGSGVAQLVLRYGDLKSGQRSNLRSFRFLWTTVISWNVGIFYLVFFAVLINVSALRKSETLEEDSLIREKTMFGKTFWRSASSSDGQLQRNKLDSYWYRGTKPVRVWGKMWCQQCNVDFCLEVRARWLGLSESG